MKAIFKFDLEDPDDARRYKIMSKAEDYAHFVFEYSQQVLRPYYKHGVPENLKDPEVLMEHLRDRFYELLGDNDLKTDY